MLIGIDGNEANVEKKVGIGEYSFELLKQFSIFNFQFSIKSKNINFQIYLKNEPLPDLPKQNKSWKYKIVQPKKLWTQFALPLNLYLTRPRPDVFFTPSHYAPRFSPVPTVVSIMDLSYIHFPEMFKRRDLYQLNNWTAYSARNAKKILTISESSKNDIIKEYDLPQGRVVVIYPGIKAKKTMPNSKILKEKYGIDSDFVLFVGTLQ